MAKTSVGSLAAILTTDSAQFKAGMHSAARTAKITATSIASSFNRTGGAVLTSLGGGILTAVKGAAVTATAAAAGLGYLTSQSMSAMDANAKLADRLGISTESLTGLQHAANLAGVDGEAFGGVLEKLTKNIGVAAIEGGPAAKTLEGLGLSVDRLAGMRADETFLAVADSIAKLPTAYERAKAATDLFGRSGQQLLNTLMAGSAGIRATMKEADALGLSYSRVDAAKVEAANDAWTRVYGVLTGIGNALAIEVAPYLDAAGMQIVEVVKRMGGIGPIVRTSFRYAVGAVGIFADTSEAVAEAASLRWLQFKKILIDTLAAAAKGYQYVAGLVGLDAGASGAVLFAGQASAAIAKEIEAAQERINDMQWGDAARNALDAIEGGANEAARAVARNAEEANNLAGGLADAAKKQKALNDAAKVGEEVRRSLKSPGGEFNEALAKLSQAGGLSAEDRQAFLFDAFQKLKGSLGSGSSQVQFAPAAIAGSSAEKSLIARSSYQPPKDRTVSDILTEVKEMNRARQDEARKFAEEFAATVGVIDF